MASPSPSPPLPPPSIRLQALSTPEYIARSALEATVVAGASAAPIAAVHFALGLSLPSGGGSGGGSDAPFRTFPAALGAAGRHALYATLLTLAWAGGANGLAAAGREALKMGPRHGGPPLKVNDWRVAGVGAAAGAAAGAGVAAAAAAAAAPPPRGKLVALGAAGGVLLPWALEVLRTRAR
jgi:hypothetical protein